MTYNMVMKRINIHEAKANLSRYLRESREGETIVVCRRNEPVAEIRPIPAPERRPRPVGLERGSFKVTAAFLKPLPRGLLDAFEGRRG